MFGGRSAITMLITFILLCPCARGSLFIDVPSVSIDSRITDHAGPAIGWLPARPARAATLSQFTLWKSRPKGVLEDAGAKAVEECDLGPAIVPDRRIPGSAIELASNPHSTRPPLRC